MATYRELKGLTVPYLDADLPSASATSQEGSVWYNSATGKLRTFVAFNTWATSAPLINTRAGGAGIGTATAGLSVTGQLPATTATTEEYNGSGWAAGGNVNTGRFNAYGGGTQTAGLIFGGGLPGGNQDLVEEYDGSAWAEQTDLPAATTELAGAGTQTAGLAFGGYVTANVAEAYEYDGSSWTAGGDMNTARRQ